MPDDLQSHWTALCERMLSVHSDVAHWFEFADLCLERARQKEA